MRISDAVSPARPIKVQFEKDSLAVEYRPMSYTTDELDRMQADAEDQKALGSRQATDAMIDTMLKLIVSWDLTDNEDVLVPLNKVALRTVPMNVFTEIMREVGADQSAGEARKS